MNMKATKKMRGFMCQPQAATAVCKSADLRSVIQPRTPTDRILVERTRLISNTRYTRLADHRHAVASVSRRPSLTSNSISSSIISDCQDRVKLDQSARQLASASQVFQVVVMRVSLHCQGCAGKVKKHLSKMEGVTSFKIDLESKRVTVMGHVSPVCVLESISKVKKAEFWP